MIDIIATLFFTSQEWGSCFKIVIKPVITFLENYLRYMNKTTDSCGERSAPFFDPVELCVQEQECVVFISVHFKDQVFFAVVRDV